MPLETNNQPKCCIYELWLSFVKLVLSKLLWFCIFERNYGLLRFLGIKLCVYNLVINYNNLFHFIDKLRRFIDCR